uniref:Uncharacterized protein n=1 Tax=Nelumbo nucifera TaxID=4432 RepID=A0A822YXE9_NELNU|nr:TPA_asm: hypothetical protein HUJ06_006841 [Nelumbo nucifera]
MHLLTSETNVFNRIPDPIVLLIFNHLFDIKSSIRCRAADNQVVKVDRVIFNETGKWSFLLHLLRSILQSFQDLISLRRLPIQPQNRNSPTEILCGDLRLEKDVVVRWRAEFGKTLKSYLIFVLRVVWTISTLFAASTRHCLLRDVIREHIKMESLVLEDKEEEGTMVIDKEGLREFREAAVDEERKIETGGGEICSVVRRMEMNNVSTLFLYFFKKSYHILEIMLKRLFLLITSE